MLNKQLRYFPLVVLLLFTVEYLRSQADSAANKNLSFDLGITRGHNINLWPFFKRYKSPEKKEIQVLFPFYAQNRNYTNHTGHFRTLPFYISDSSSKGVHQRFISLYYPSLLHTHSREDSTGKYKSFKVFELAPHISLLGLSQSSNGLKVDHNIFFFILYRKDVLRSRTSLVVFPAYWYFSTKKDTTSLLFPLYFSRKSSDARYLNIAALYNQKRSSFEIKRSLFPLWWNSISYGPTDTLRKNILFPLYWRKYSRDQAHTILLPLLFNVRNRDYHSFTFFPLFSYGSTPDRSSKHLFLTPLFWHTRSLHQRSDVLFPLYWRFHLYKKEDTIKKNILFPVYWSVRSKTRNNTVLFPVLYSTNTNYYRSFTCFPFFSHGYSKDSLSSFFSVTPLFWHIRYESSVRNILFPLYSNHTYLQNNDTIRKDWVFPFYWSYQSARVKRQTFFPVYWYIKTREEEKRIVFPIVFDSKNRYYRSMTVIPLFSFGRSADSSHWHKVMTPLYWRFKSPERSTEVLFPLLWQGEKIKQNDTIRRKSILFLYWRTTSADKNNRVLFPFVYSFKSKNKTSFTLFPFFSHGHWLDSSRSHIGITPFYWRLKSRHELINILWPVYWSINDYRYNDTIRTRVVFPIIWLKRSNEESKTTVFPFIFSHSTDYKNRFTFFPLFSYGYDRERNRSHIMITPLFWHTKKRNLVRNSLFPVYWHKTLYKPHDTLTQHVVFPLYWSKKDREGHSRVLFPLLFDIKNESKRFFMFFPLFSFGKDADSSRSHLVATPLFWRFQSREKTSHVLFPLYWSIRDYSTADTVQKRVLFPLYWSVHTAKKRNDIFLPFLFKLHNSAYHSFTFFPLFSYGRGVTDNRRYLLITPLFGNIHFNDQAHTYLFPLFNYKKTVEGKNYSLLLFVFRRSVKNNYSATSILWPFCERIKTDTYKKLRIAPLFWHARSDSFRMVTVLPFFYSQKNPLGNTFILSAFLYKRKRVFGTSISNSILFRAYYSKTYTNGDFEKRFLHLIAANVKVNGRREKIIFPFYRSVKESNGDHSVSYLLGLYNRFKEYKPSIHAFYEEERVLWFVRLRSNYRQLQQEGKGDFVRKKQKRSGRTN